jgi:hypothetical protein
MTFEPAVPEVPTEELGVRRLVEPGVVAAGDSEP